MRTPISPSSLFLSLFRSLSLLTLFPRCFACTVKYLGLLALNSIMQIHPKAVAEHKDLVLNCLDDDDVTIRLRALDLLEGMVRAWLRGVSVRVVVRVRVCVCEMLCHIFWISVLSAHLSVWHRPASAL